MNIILFSKSRAHMCIAHIVSMYRTEHCDCRQCNNRSGGSHGTRNNTFTRGFPLMMGQNRRHCHQKASHGESVQASDWPWIVPIAFELQCSQWKSDPLSGALASQRPSMASWHYKIEAAESERTAQGFGLQLPLAYILIQEARKTRSIPRQMPLRTDLDHTLVSPAHRTNRQHTSGKISTTRGQH